ncbi:hypothetical protein [Humidisolicoccus flavus]|uniref:hypothetical protein n=1 Tax=Humidisolicoccus flavus TaxID=3111414 RepID=UPI003251293D
MSAPEQIGPFEPAADVVPFGRVPIPNTPADFTERLRRAIAENFASNAQYLDRVLIDVALAGPDVERLDITLTSVRVPLIDTDEGDAPGMTSVQDVALRTPALLNHLRVNARPVVIEGVDVLLEVELHGLRFAWIETHAGELALEFTEPSAEAPVHGFINIRAHRSAVVEALREVLEGALGELGVTLKELDIELESIDARTVRVRGFAKLRKGLLSASATIAGVATLSNDLQFRLSEVSATSKNPVIAAILLGLRKKVKSVEDESYDLAKDLPAGVRIADVQVNIGDEIAVAVLLEP